MAIRPHRPGRFAFAGPLEFSGLEIEISLHISKPDPKARYKDARVCPDRWNITARIVAGILLSMAPSRILGPVPG
jgi:hypothetical protein